MNKYELMYIIDVSLEDEPRKELIERVSALITGDGGEVEKIDEWGKRRLAYPINYKNEGYYVLMNFSAKPELPREIERVLQINDNVLRYLVIKLEEKHTSVKPRQTPLRPQYGRPYDPEASAQPEADLGAPQAAEEAAEPAQQTAPAVEPQAEAAAQPEADTAPAEAAETVADA